MVKRLGFATSGQLRALANGKHVQFDVMLGIGWRGLNQKEIDAVGGSGIFCQRVFAQGYTVGAKGIYHYWRDHHRQPLPGSAQFWMPESLKARYSVAKGLTANQGRIVGQILTVVTAPVMIAMVALAGIRINAVPDKNWQIPLDGPDLPAPFAPQVGRYGPATAAFDQGYDAPGQARDKDRVRDAGDPYAGDRPIRAKSGAAREASDAAMGDVATESSLRYEDHARLRMQARREGLVAKTAQRVEAEDNPETASAEYTAWRNSKIKTFLAATVDTHATDHSTIMTNPMHAQRALAYDVAVGHCHILDEDLRKLRIVADWRFLDGLDPNDANRAFREYFSSGLLRKLSVFAWANTDVSEGRMPDKIVDVREHPARRQGSHPVQGDGA